MSGDDYSSLGSAMKSRLDDAETAMAKVRDWIDLKAADGPASNRMMQELCLVLGWARPKPYGGTR